MSGFPYIHIPTYDGPGPFDLQPFGPLVAAGVLLGVWMGRKYAERNGLSEDAMRYLGMRVLVWGFIACHVFNTLFYEWDRFVEDPLLILKIWDGIASWGGIIGGGLALYIYTGIKKLDRLRWGDWAAYGAIGGWVPGRLACAVVHDHLGYPTDFFLGVDFPPHTYTFDKASTAVIRAHDLGLYETIMLVPIFIAMILLERWKGRKPGFLLGFLAVSYSAPRFFLEFLRRPESDPRYGGLTFAQYACVAALVGGMWLLLRRPRPEPLPEAVAEPAPRPTRKKQGKKRR